MAERRYERLALCLRVERTADDAWVASNARSPGGLQGSLFFHQYPRRADRQIGNALVSANLSHIQGSMGFYSDQAAWLHGS